MLRYRMARTRDFWRSTETVPQLMAKAEEEWRDLFEDVVGTLCVAGEL